jgi:nucleoside-diphosphate-sugar epimerase
MRVLVTGAGGFLGRNVVAAFASGPHEVRGLVRSDAQTERVRAAHGHPVRGDVLVPESLATAIEGCDLVVHLAQAGAGSLELRRQVRVEGVRNVAAAMRSSGVRRLLVGSGYWVYADSPDGITEGSPIAPVSISQVNFETEVVARQFSGRGRLEVVVVRPGMVYGGGSWFEEMVREIRDGRYRYILPGENYLSPVHEEDAGQAFRIIAEQWRPGETYLVVDDRPVPTRRFAEFVAEILQAPSPQGISFADAEREWGADIARLNLASRAASNAKLKTLGWRPGFRTFEDGVPSVLASMPDAVPTR